MRAFERARKRTLARSNDNNNKKVALTDRFHSSAHERANASARTRAHCTIGVAHSHFAILSLFTFFSTRTAVAASSLPPPLSASRVTIRRCRPTSALTSRVNKTANALLCRAPLAPAARRSSPSAAATTAALFDGPISAGAPKMCVRWRRATAAVTAAVDHSAIRRPMLNATATKLRARTRAFKTPAAYCRPSSGGGGAALYNWACARCMATK